MKAPLLVHRANRKIIPAALPESRYASRSKTLSVLMGFFLSVDFSCQALGMTRLAW